MGWKIKIHVVTKALNISSLKVSKDVQQFTDFYQCPAALELPSYHGPTFKVSGHRGLAFQKPQ